MAKYIPPELVERVQAGDERALRELIDLSKGMIKRIAFRFPRLRSDIDDVLQEIAIKVFKDVATLDNTSAYPKWLERTTIHYCLNETERKRPIPLSNVIDPSEGFEPEDALVYAGSEKSIYETSQDTESAFDDKVKIDAIFKALRPEDISLLKRHYIGGETIEEIAPSVNLKKSACAEILSVAKAECILEGANLDWQISDFNEAESKLLRLTSDFKPDEGSKGKRHVLASALTRLGDIYQVRGQIDGSGKSIDRYRLAERIWTGLRNKTMISYTRHMVGLCHNVAGRHDQALKILNEVKNNYGGEDAHTKRLRGDLERDMGSILVNLGEYQLAESHVKASLQVLENTEHRESYYAALRVIAKIQIKLRQFDRAYDRLQESIKDSPRYRALHHVQTKITLIKLFFS